jgi:hypothetical protein
MNENTDTTRMFVLHYRLTKDKVSPDKSVIANKGELILLALDPDKNGYMAQTSDGRVSFYVTDDEIEEE